MQLSARLLLSVIAVLALPVARVSARPHSGSDTAPAPAPAVRHQHHGHHMTIRSRARLCAGQHATQEQRRRCFCGRELAEAIREICRGRGYNEPHSASGSARSSGSGGGATDCCYRGCSYAELEQFCMPRPGQDTSPVASEESEALSDNIPLDEAHQENHIRPVSNVEDFERTNETTDRPSSQVPSVIGGRAPSKEHDFTRRHDMISVGTITTPRRSPVPIPVPAQWRSNSHHTSSSSSSNSLV